ncbi:MAG: dockerin type I domain-containing protein, partial [Verrucomicrobiota bacterium]|nr:dockerin type I domain-containing protein [Verrucomicrobiota bacterium]
YTNEYIATTGTFNWKTRIGNFKFANTTAPAQGTISGTITACDSGAPVKDALVQVTSGPSTGFSAASAPDGTYSLNVVPGNYTVTVVDPAHLCTAAGPFNLTVTNGATTTQNACLSGAPQFLLTSSTLSASGGNGNGIVEPNECNSIDVTLLNNGCAIGKNVFARLSSSTAGVTVTQPNSPYSDTVENGAPTNTIPFSFSTSNTLACGTVINFVLTVTYDGGSTTLPFTVATCNIAPVTQNGALINGTDAQQQGRMGRDGQVAVCGSTKTCPGVFAGSVGSPRLFRQHTFTNGPAAACATITFSPSCANLFPVAYLGSYDPANLCTNYLGDPGGSPAAGGSTSFSVNLAANATLVVVVEEANAGLAGCSSYSVSVAGLIGNGTGNGVCAAPPMAVSRKQHGSGGPIFDIPMPLTGPTGVEDRGTQGGNHTIVLTYPTSPAGAVVTVAQRNPSATATGNVSSTSVSGNDLIVELTGVSSPQVLSLYASGGTNISPAVVPVGFLIGDVNADRSVNSADGTTTRNNAGLPLNGTNFRADVNADGFISAADSTTVRNNSGQALPAPGP